MMSETPNSDKLSTSEAEAILMFAEWLNSQNLYIVDEYGDLAMEYLGIDPVALEQERRAILKQARERF